MKIKGKVIGFEEGYHIIEIDDKVERFILNDKFEVDTYLYIEKLDNNEYVAHEIFMYKSLLHREIIKTDDTIHSDVEFLSPFEIIGCLHKEEAECLFLELLNKSSCNYVEGLTYKEDDDGFISVSGKIGIYYIKQYGTKEIAEKFNEEYRKNIELVEKLLEEELTDHSQVNIAHKKLKSIIFIMFIILILISSIKLF